jgi:phage terminase large subunit-like protein
LREPATASRATRSKVHPQHLAQKLAVEKRERGRESFRFFARQAWPVLEPGTDLLWNWHLDAICDHLQAVFERRIKRLAITMAPGHAKSSFVSDLFPVWCWISDPYSRWLCASYSMDLAVRDNKNRRDLIESNWFQESYGPLFVLSSSQNVKGFFENDKRGYMIAVAVRASGTGKRGTHLLIDDPNNAMAGLADIEATKDWFGKTWMSRLNDQENGSMIIVGQRLHEEDLIGHVLKLGGWEHLNLPEEYESARKSYTSIGWEDPREREGELLWPEKFPPEVLDKLKRELGPLDYSAQYQQSPIPTGGYIYKEKDRRWFTIDQQTQSYLLETPRGRVTVPIKDCWNLAVIDLAVSTRSTADFFLMETWAITPYKDALLLHALHEHLDFPEQQQQIPLIFQRFMHSIIAVEKVGYQLAMIQYLISLGLPIKPFQPKADKIMRSTTGSILYSNGKVYHNKNMEGIEEAEKELFSFPKAPHDEYPDCHAMMALVISTYGRPGLLDLDAEQEEIDTTLSIEHLKQAEALTAEQQEQAEQEAKAKEQEVFTKGGLLINPWEWSETHEGGSEGWE